MRNTDDTADKPASSKATITDSARKWFLEANGYIPQNSPSLDSDTDFVDWALENRHCPAYWRPWKPGDRDTDNGMIFVKRGDRDRIDQCIKRQLDRLSPADNQSATVSREKERPNEL